LTRKLLQRQGSKEHFIRVAHHAVPSQVAYLIDNLRRVRACICQITAVENQVGRGPFQIPQNRFKRRSIPMNVGQDCNAHAQDFRSWRLLELLFLRITWVYRSLAALSQLVMIAIWRSEEAKKSSRVILPA
jgi:hypothetical protein